MDNVEKKIDYEIEQFWLSLKNSMINLYNKTLFKRPIHKWSDNLNNLQKKSDYNEIEKHIIYYISLYAYDLMRLNDFYHINILSSNIKRWDKICLKNKIYCPRKDKYINLTFALLNIYEYLMDKYDISEYNHIFQEIELMLVFNNYDKLLEYAFTNKCPSIIDKLLIYDYTIIESINKLKNTNFNYPIKGKKIFKLLNIKL